MNSVKWGLALLPITFGLICQLITLWVLASLVRQCIQTRQYKNTSGLPFIGPLFICLGLRAVPVDVPVWLFLLPWGLDILALAVGVVVVHVTGAVPRAKIAALQDHPGPVREPPPPR